MVQKTHLDILMICLSMVTFCVVVQMSFSQEEEPLVLHDHASLRLVLDGIEKTPLVLCPEIFNNSEFVITSMLSCAHDQSSFGNYQLSAMKLGVSIQETHSNSESDMILILAGCPRHMKGLRRAELQSAGWQLCFVPLIHGPTSIPQNTNRFLMSGMFSKLNVWLLEEYRAVFFIDSDALVIQSISEGIVRMNQRLETENKSIAASMQQMTTCSPFECLVSNAQKCPVISDESVGVNAGVFLIKPSKARFLALSKAIDRVNYDIAWAEQGLLNHLYPPGTYVEMDNRYNYMTFQNPCGQNEWDELLKGIFILHLTHPKPWECAWKGLSSSLYTQLHGYFTALIFNSFKTCKLWQDAPSVAKGPENSE